MTETIAVAGAGLAGGTAAAALREEGFDGRIVLVGEEDIPPYERPPLSKEYLRGEQSLEECLVRPEAWYGEQGIELRLGVRLERLDAAGRSFELSDGSRVPFDRAVIATGARNRRLNVPGADLGGVFDLRRPADADRIREASAGGAHAAIVGMGFIGAEVAASLRSLGAEVTVVELFSTALERVLGAEVGAVLEAVHRDHGVRMHFQESAERFEGGDRVGAMVTTSGRRVECDFAVVGVGVQPNVEAVAGTDVAVDDGILVDAALETTVPGVYAVGDVARHDHPRFGRIRVEHFDNALKMGPVVARNLLGAGEAFDDPHWFWSDQYDVNLQMAGVAGSWDRLVFRGSVEERSFSAFYLSDGVLLSAVSVNRPRDVRRAMPLIKAGARPDPGALRDEDVDLRTLAPAAT
ncbi:MAG: FAD-dependent oxidoreductase [Actinomycetota bacterium]|nr:FAD-dependent oxidoreductase [Actinomycetota bacterium]